MVTDAAPRQLLILLVFIIEQLRAWDGSVWFGLRRALWTLQQIRVNIIHTAEALQSDTCVFCTSAEVLPLFCCVSSLLCLSGRSIRVGCCNRWPRLEPLLLTAEHVRHKAHTCCRDTGRQTAASCGQWENYTRSKWTRCCHSAVKSKRLKAIFSHFQNKPYVFQPIKKKRGNMNAVFVSSVCF